MLAQWAEAFDDFGAEVSESIDAHPWVICDTSWYGKGNGSDMPIDIHVVDTYELKDGKIVRYPDVASALEAVGLRE